MEARRSVAEQFLAEAVFRSRGAQAGASLLAPDERLPDGGKCGLGGKASVVLDLTPKAETLFEELWPSGLAEERLDEVRSIMTGWIEKQDALDRKRNHFLKDFRGKHGFSRADYDEETKLAYRAGLDRVNGEVDEGRKAAAETLLTIA